MTAWPPFFRSYAGQCVFPSVCFLELFLGPNLMPESYARILVCNRFHILGVCVKVLHSARYK